MFLVNKNIKLFLTLQLSYPVLNLHINPHAISIKLTILIMQISIVKQAKTNRLLFVTNHDDDNNPLETKELKAVSYYKDFKVDFDFRALL